MKVRIATPRVLGTLLILSLFVNVAFIEFACTKAYIRSFDEQAKGNSEPILTVAARENKTAAMRVQEEANLLKKLSGPLFADPPQPVSKSKEDLLLENEALRQLLEDYTSRTRLPAEAGNRP